MSDRKNFWSDVLKCPKKVVAPMVDASELAWRLLSRRHGADLCYSPMYHSAVFSKDARYRSEALATCPEDRPLIIQFCGNDAETICQAALLAQSHCDAIDINLGCPQSIAKRGRYGAFLQDEWELLTEIVTKLKNTLSVPVTCKIRVFEEIEKTVNYAKMLESAGCSMLTVHGRTREQKGPLTGVASWKHIKAVKENIQIPLLANGNIQCIQDVENCILETNCDGVMSAEGNLYNPFIFESVYPPCWEVALEYLDLVDLYPCPLSYIRGHLFKLFHHIFALPENKDLRNDLAEKGSVQDFRNVVRGIKERYTPYQSGEKSWCGKPDSFDLVLPPWLCQSYVRPSPEEHIKKMEDAQMKNNLEKENVDSPPEKRNKLDLSSVDGRKLSKRKYKKLLKYPDRVGHTRKMVELCSDNCPNPMGMKCDYRLCKSCCRIKCYNDHLDCGGHGILIKTRREKARMRCNQSNTVESSDVNTIVDGVS